MIKNIILLEDREQNSFFDERKQNNGGGYHQPLVKYSFEYNDKNFTLVYDDTSCGDFGCRYNVSIYDQNNKTIYDFNVDRVSNREDELYFSDEFDVIFFHNLLDSKLREYIDFNSYDEILDFYIIVINDYFDED